MRFDSCQRRKTSYEFHAPLWDVEELAEPFQVTSMDVQGPFCLITRKNKYFGYLGSNLWWAVNRTSILKLLFTIVTAGIDARVVSENKFLYAWVREVCRLWARPLLDTFHRLIIVEALWSQPVLQVGKQVVVARSEIRTVRRVVKQLPVKKLSSARVREAVCRHALSWRSTMSTLVVFCSEWQAVCRFFSVSRALSPSYISCLK
jgi:hypothetical protein